MQNVDCTGGYILLQIHPLVTSQEGVSTKIFDGQISSRLPVGTVHQTDDWDKSIIDVGGYSHLSCHKLIWFWSIFWTIKWEIILTNSKIGAI